MTIAVGRLADEDCIGYAYATCNAQDLHWHLFSVLSECNVSAHVVPSPQVCTGIRHVHCHPMLLECMVMTAFILMMPLCDVLRW